MDTHLVQSGSGNKIHRSLRGRRKKALICFDQNSAISSVNDKLLNFENSVATPHLLKSKPTNTKKSMDCYRQSNIYMEIWSLGWNKWRMLESCDCVWATIWLHYLNFNETLWKGENRLGQHKSTAYYWTNSVSSTLSNNRSTTTDHTHLTKHSTQTCSACWEISTK